MRVLGGCDIWAMWQPLNVGMEGEGKVKDWGPGGLTEPLGPPGRNVVNSWIYRTSDSYSETAAEKWIKPGK